MSPQTVSTKLARIAQEAGRIARGWAATVMSPCGLVNCKVLGPQGPLLTNRMTELVTYGSVGGVGGNPGPYPALDAAMIVGLHLEGRSCRARLPFMRWLLVLEFIPGLTNSLTSSSFPGMNKVVLTHFMFHRALQPKTYLSVTPLC